VPENFPSRTALAWAAGAFNPQGRSDYRFPHPIDRLMYPNKNQLS